MKAKRITSGDLGRAIAKVNPIVTDDMVRAWCEKGLVSAHRNPGSLGSWWFINAEAIPNLLLKILRFTPQEARLVLEALGLVSAEGKMLNAVGHKSLQ